MRIPCIVSVLGFVLLVGCFKAPTEAETPKPPVLETSVKQPAPDSANAGKSVSTRAEKQTVLGLFPPDVPEIKPRQLTPYNPAGTGPPNLVCFSPDGKTVLNAFSPGFEPTVLGWDVETGKETVKMKHKGMILALAVTPDGKTVAAAGENGVIRLWDPVTGEEKAVLEQQTPVEALAFSPDGKTLAGAGGSRTILWEVATGKFIQRLEAQFSHLRCVAFSPAGKVLAAGGRLEVGDPVYLWETATGEVHPVLARPPKVALRCLQSMSARCDSLAFSPDGKTLAAAAAGNVLHWDVATRQDVAMGGDIATDPEDGALNATSVAFSPDGKTLAVGSMRGMVYFRDVATGKYKAYGEGHFVGRFPDRPGQKVGSLAFSPDGKTLASAGQDGTVQMWDVPLAK